MHLQFYFIVIILFVGANGLRPEENSLLPHNQVGFKFGYNYAGMNYFNKIHDNYATSTFRRTLWGLTGQHNISRSFSINPELVYIEKGQIIQDDFDYRLRTNYLDLNIAFLLHLYPSNRIANPYLSLGPSVGILLSGDIAYNDYKINVSKANMAPYNFGIRLAAGLQKIIKIKNKKAGTIFFEGAYQLGQMDTYSTKEKNSEAIALNAIDYRINGSRKHKGWELELGIMVPIDIFKKQREKGAIPESEKYSENSIVEKDCYSIEEIVDYYNQGLDIRNLKICLFSINFEFDRSTLTKESKTYLNDIAKLLNSIGNLKLQINGHTDNKGAKSYNQILSERRAKSVFLYLTLESGINKNRLSFKGFGETKPIASNETDEGRARNRRVEFEILEQ